jgi:tetraacyldisaccharide 4'-kinase
MNPLSGIYGGVTAVRNAFYNRGLISIERLRQPVVSVGNISAGGSGKTPFVIALGELLKARGITFDVLSRGYRRKTRGVMVVEPDGSATDFGDEPLLIARRLGVPVIVGESRYAAGQLAESRFQSQLHILDDGFQHRSLFRDFDIVLLSQRDFEDRLLPLGRLREPLSALTRADAIVLPQDATVDLDLLQQKRTWTMQRELMIPDAPAAPIVFCGIARPQQFFTQVRAAGIQAVEEVTFRNHHSYYKRDIERLLALRIKSGADGFITTEKDSVNLGTLQSSLAPCAVASLTVTIDRPADLVDAILTRISDRKPRS